MATPAMFMSSVFMFLIALPILLWMEWVLRRYFYREPMGWYSFTWVMLFAALVFVRLPS